MEKKLRNPSIVLAVCFLLAFHGCAAWRPVEHPPEDTELGELRVTLEDSTRVLVWEARVHADTLFGTLGRETYDQTSWGDSLVIPLARILTFEERDVERTDQRTKRAQLGIVAGAVVIGLVGFYLATRNMGFERP